MGASFQGTCSRSSAYLKAARRKHSNGAAAAATTVATTRPSKLWAAGSRAIAVPLFPLPRQGSWRHVRGQTKLRRHITSIRPRGLGGHAALDAVQGTKELIATLKLNQSADLAPALAPLDFLKVSAPNSMVNAALTEVGRR
jgi:hypothetical protein